MLQLAVADTGFQEPQLLSSPVPEVLEVVQCPSLLAAALQPRFKPLLPRLLDSVLQAFLRLLRVSSHSLALVAAAEAEGLVVEAVEQAL